MFKTPQVLDLFSGIGGFSLGLERAGFKTVAFCEIDKKARQVLKKHWPTIPIYQNIKELTCEKLKKDGITNIEIICGGFPCQDISNLGQGAGIKGERSGLWSEMCRVISEIRPQFAIVENVAALRRRGLSRVLGDLAEIGYDTEWHCIPASAVGAPHQRDRLWIIAYPHGKLRFPLNIYPRADKKSVQTVMWKNFFFVRSGTNDFKFRQEDQSYLCGGNNGLSARMDRLKQLGNAVVPQIPELIGRAVLEASKKQLKKGVYNKT